MVIIGQVLYYSMVIIGQVLYYSMVIIGQVLYYSMVIIGQAGILIYGYVLLSFFLEEQHFLNSH